MRKKSIAKRLITVLATGVMVSILASSAYAAKPLATIEISSINDLAAGVNNVCQALGIPGMDQMLIGMIGGPLHAPGLQGVDKTKPILLHVFMPDAGKDMGPMSYIPSLVLVIPVDNGGETYLATLKQMSPDPIDAGNGVLHFPALPSTIPTPNGTYVGTAGDNVVVGDRQGIIKDMTAKVAEKANASSCLLGLPGALRIGLDIQECLPPLEAAIEQGLASMQDLMAMAPNATGMDPATILKAEADILLALLRQVEGITIGIMPRTRTLDFYTRIDPVGNSTLSGIIKNLKQPALNYRNALPENAFFATAGNGMDAFNNIIEPYCKFMEELYSSMGPQFSGMGTLASKSMANMKGMYAGDYAIGLVPGPGGEGIGFVEIIEITDAKKMNKIMDDMMVMWTEQKMPGFEMKKGESRTYNDMEIQSFIYSFDPTAGQPATPMPFMLPEWLKNMKMEMAFSGNDMIYTMGKPEIMNTTIERLKSIGTSIENTPAFKKLIPKLKHKPVALYTFSLVKLAKNLLSSVMPPEQLAAIPDNSDGIAGYVMVSGDNLVEIERVSLSEIAAIKSAVPMLQGMMMGMMMGGCGMPGDAMPPGAGAPGAAPMMMPPAGMPTN